MDEGFPQFLYYQNLPHVSVVALHRLLLGTIDIFTVFNIVRYLGLVLLPLTVFWSMRRMDFDTVASAVAAAASTLLATNFLYGFDFGSYLWRGLGLYTQIWAMHLSFIALASLWRLLRYGTGFRWTAVVLAVLVLSHLLYAYMMVVTAALLLVWGVTRANALVRIARLAGAGAIASLLPLQETLLFHRFIGGVHIAAIMLIGVGGSAIFTLLQAERSHARTALAAAAIAILLVPAVKERLDFENLNGLWMRQTKAAIDADTDMASIVSALRGLPAGRVYAGLRSNWGEQLDFAIPFRSVHAYQYLVTERFRMLAPPYGGASLNSDLQFDFNDQIAAQYDLYNVRYVVAPRS